MRFHISLAVTGLNVIGFMVREDTFYGHFTVVHDPIVEWSYSIPTMYFY